MPAVTDTMRSSLGVARGTKTTSKPSSSKARPSLLSATRKPFQDKLQPRSSSSTKHSITSRTEKAASARLGQVLGSSSAGSIATRSSSPSSRHASPPASPSQRRALSPLPTTQDSCSTSFQANAADTVAIATEERTGKVQLSVPLRLPRPELEVISDPHTDLAGHLRRHSLAHDADALEATASTMPAEYLLHAYLSAGQVGRSSLLAQTVEVVPRLRAQIEAQITRDAPLPSTLHLDLSVESCGVALLPPTHLLAAYTDTHEAILLPVHAHVLALQCTSIPFLPPSPATAVSKERSGRTVAVPVVPLCVPHAGELDLTYRWLYDPRTPSLYEALVPLRFALRFLSTLPATDTNAEKRIALALSHLSTRTLLGTLTRIQAVWKNGVALGILAPAYWAQLDKAWAHVIDAIVIARRRPGTNAR